MCNILYKLKLKYENQVENTMHRFEVMREDVS